MDKLPGVLHTREGLPRPGKRQRTRRQLIEAAIDVFSSRGVAQATMHEIAEAAGMTTGTVYNHFRTKAEIVNAVALWIAQTIRQRSTGARAKLKLASEQIAAGCRRYLGLAQSSPAWALLVLDVASVDPAFRKTITTFVLDGVRQGIRRKEFSVASEAAALDLVIGATMEGMRHIALGKARRHHAIAVTTVILRGLGLPPGRAGQIAAKPLPLFDS